MKTILALTVLLASCGLPTSADNPEAAMFWRMAQADVAPLVGPAAYLVPMSLFKITIKHGTFKCGEVKEAVGCFETPSHITIDGWYVLRHEGAHAILYRLGDERWRCYPHTWDITCK
jgi:hypothetical protein